MLLRIKDALATVASTGAADAPHETLQVTPQVAKLLQILTSPMSREQLQQRLGLADRKSFRQVYLQPALQHGLIEMTVSDKPRSKLQQYRLTAVGKAALQRSEEIGAGR